jgi:hypothetical protein
VWITGLTSLVAVAMMADRFDLSVPLVLLAVFILALGASWYWSGEKLTKPLRVMGNLGTFIILFCYNWSVFWEVVDDGWYYGLTLLVMMVILAPVFWWSLKLLPREKGQGKYLLALGLVTLVIGFLQLVMAGLNDYSVLPGYEMTFALLTCFLTGGLGAGLLMLGMKQNRLGQMNGGLIILCLVIFFRFVDADISMLVRGLAFVVIGSIFFGTNYWLGRKFKELQPEKIKDEKN